MPEENKNQNTTHQDKTELEKKIEQMVSQNNDSAQKLTALLADPDVATVVAAKNRGEQIQISVGRGKDSEPNGASANEKQTQVDWEDLADRPQEFAGAMIDQIKKHVDHTVSSAIKAAVPMSPEELRELQNSQASRERQDINGQVSDCRKKYPDFAQYEQDIVQLNRDTNGSLRVEELYVMAKARKSGGFNISEANTSTEKPNPQPTIDVSKLKTDAMKEAKEKGKSSSQALRDVIRGTARASAEGTLELHEGLGGTREDPRSKAG